MCNKSKVNDFNGTQYLINSILNKVNFVKWYNLKLPESGGQKSYNV